MWQAVHVKTFSGIECDAIQFPAGNLMTTFVPKGEGGRGTKIIHRARTQKTGAKRPHTDRRNTTTEEQQTQKDRASVVSTLPKPRTNHSVHHLDVGCPRRPDANASLHKAHTFWMHTFSANESVGTPPIFAGAMRAWSRSFFLCIPVLHYLTAAVSKKSDCSVRALARRGIFSNSAVNGILVRPRGLKRKIVETRLSELWIGNTLGFSCDRE